MEISDYFSINPFGHQVKAKKEEWISQCVFYSKLLQEVFQCDQAEILKMSSAYRKRPKDLLEAFFAMTFWRQAVKHELTENARSMAILSAIIACEGMFPKERKRKNKKGKSVPIDREKHKRFVRFMRECVDEDDKKLMLKAFAFSAPESFPTKRVNPRHLTYRSMIKWNAYYQDKYCFTQTENQGGCYCLEWIDTLSKEKVNYHFDRLSIRLYQMRSSIVHDAYSVMFCHNEKRPADVASWSMTVVDSFKITVGKKQGWLVPYESALSRDTLEDIFRKAFKKAFIKGWPQKQ